MISYKDKVYGQCSLLRFVIKLEVNIYGCHGYASKLRNNFKVQVIFEVVLCLKFAFSSKFDFNIK